jgi:hypothetical protein
LLRLNPEAVDYAGLKAAVDCEYCLQRYIFDHPDALPLDVDVRLLVLLREFSTASGPIDALVTDGDG